MICKSRVRIISNGIYIPSAVRTTESIMEYANCAEAGLSANTLSNEVGIVSVLQAAEEETWTDMATTAAEDCLSRSSVHREQIDMIIYTGIDKDYVEPSTAHFIQRRLGIKRNIPAVDVSNACQGMLSGITVANAHIGNGDAKYILVVTAEKGTRLGNMVAEELRRGVTQKYFTEKMGVFTIGDAAGAVLIGKSHSADSGFIAFNTSSRGRYAELCAYKIVNDKVVGHMRMAQITGAGIKEHRSQILITKKALGWDSSDVDCLMTHQFGGKPFKMLSDISGVPESKMTKTFSDYGNLATATFSINFSKGIEQNLIKPGSKVLGMFAGSGITTAHFGYVH